MSYRKRLQEYTSVRWKLVVNEKNIRHRTNGIVRTVSFIDCHYRKVFFQRLIPLWLLTCNLYLALVRTTPYGACPLIDQLCNLELEDCGRVPDPVGEVRNSAPEAGHRWQLLSCDDLMMDVG